MVAPVSRNLERDDLWGPLSSRFGRFGDERLRLHDEKSGKGARELGVNKGRATEDRVLGNRSRTGGVDADDIGQHRQVEADREPRRDVTSVMGGADEDGVGTVPGRKTSGDGAATLGPASESPMSPTSYTLAAPKRPQTDAALALARPQVTTSTTPPKPRAAVGSSSRGGGRHPVSMLGEDPRSFHLRHLLQDLELLKEGDDALMGVTGVDDDLAGLAAASAASTEITCWREPATPTCDGSRPSSATVSASTGLDLAAASPLKEGSRGSLCRR